MNSFTRQLGLERMPAGFNPVISIYHALRPRVLFWFYLFIIHEIPSAGWIVIPVTIQASFQGVVARRAGVSV